MSTAATPYVPGVVPGEYSWPWGKFAYAADGRIANMHRPRSFLDYNCSFGCGGYRPLGLGIKTDFVYVILQRDLCIYQLHLRINRFFLAATFLIYL
ncbi:hypothetical protein SCP_0705790 [Sparassis crispa]|uniref:Uncharacterized protein n=1 Tax=Sparassis crispa TaxID=139825 RepID=A0A401GT37_9APHY|nr:hypothetical protein SCP_0705790 [Sparassis crispa]GBE85392.1 hypothetical protein SCP_0705790 [Sparassis crispa]